MNKKEAIKRLTPASAKLLARRLRSLLGDSKITISALTVANHLNLCTCDAERVIKAYKELIKPKRKRVKSEAPKLVIIKAKPLAPHFTEPIKRVSPNEQALYDKLTAHKIASLEALLAATTS